MNLRPRQEYWRCEYSSFKVSGVLRFVSETAERCARRRLGRQILVGATAVGCHQPGDALQSSQIFEVDVVDTDAQAEVLLELEKQLHELEGIKNAGLEQIGIRRWHPDVEALGEESAKALDDGDFSGQVAVLP